METLLALDRAIFLFVNHWPHSALTDALALTLSGIGRWGLIWFVISIILFAREEERDHWFFFPMIVAGVISGFLSEFLLKFLVARPRPTPLMGAMVVSPMGNYSFPSTHATLAFAFAYILSREEPRLRVWFYLLAVLIALSRMYLGVHYFSDVLAGAILGHGIGMAATVAQSQIKGVMSRGRKKRSA